MYRLQDGSYRVAHDFTRSFIIIIHGNKKTQNQKKFNVFWKLDNKNKQIHITD